MAKKDDGEANEMMETEDQVLEDMRVEFRSRLERRLQKRLVAKQRDMPEVRSLKKKAGRAAPEKHPWGGHTARP